MTTHTKDKLAAALREVGLTDMADAAEAGFYHDFLSPLANPAMQLAEDLAASARKAPDPVVAGAILAIRARHLNGEFDANTEESEAWANSPEGQDAFRRLMQKR